MGSPSWGSGVRYSDDEIARYVKDLKSLGADEDRYVDRTLLEQVARKYGVKVSRIHGAWQRNRKAMDKVPKIDPVQALVDYLVRRLDRFTKKEMDRFWRELKTALDSR